MSFLWENKTLSQIKPQKTIRGWGDVAWHWSSSILHDSYMVLHVFSRWTLQDSTIIYRLISFDLMRYNESPHINLSNYTRMWWGHMAPGDYISLQVLAFLFMFVKVWLHYLLLYNKNISLSFVEIQWFFPPCFWSHEYSMKL